jgi:hypothetical protein
MTIAGLTAGFSMCRNSQSRQESGHALFGATMVFQLWSLGDGGDYDSRGGFLRDSGCVIFGGIAYIGASTFKRNFGLGEQGWNGLRAQIGWRAICKSELWQRDPGFRVTLTEKKISLSSIRGYTVDSAIMERAVDTCAQ